MLQSESAEINDDNNKKDNMGDKKKKEKEEDDDDDNEIDDRNDPNAVMKPKKINIKKIAETIVGLKTYES